MSQKKNATRYARQATVPGTQGSRKHVELDDRAWDLGILSQKLVVG